MTRGHRISQLNEGRRKQRDCERRSNIREIDGCAVGCLAAGQAVHRQPKKTSGEQDGRHRNTKKQCHSHIGGRQWPSELESCIGV